MERFRTAIQAQAWADAQRAAGRRIGIVPTMGCLHRGHLTLLDVARGAGCNALLATIFVNPTQFLPGEDYAAYPRDEESDLSMLSGYGADAVFVPSVDEMYPENYQTFVEIGTVSEGLCGASRPGHFRGVATVVSKLLNIGKPHVAVFGEKDYQQLAVLRRLVLDLNFDVDVVAGPIIREADGLAMSSRNVFLTGVDRVAARCLSLALAQAQAIFREGERNPDRIVASARAVLAAEPRATVDYIEVRDPATLATIRSPTDAMTVLIAARVGPVRLIDNVTLRR